MKDKDQMKKIKKTIKEISNYTEYFHKERSEKMDCSHLDHPSVYAFNQAMDLLMELEKAKKTKQK